MLARCKACYYAWEMIGHGHTTLPKGSYVVLLQPKSERTYLCVFLTPSDGIRCFYSHDDCFEPVED